jgi:hypothetical protein
VQAAGASWRRRLGWYPGDWIWPSLVAAAIAGGGGAVAVAAGANEAPASRTIVATGPLAPAPKARAAGRTVRTAARPKARRAAPAASRLTAWPRTASAYTVVIASLPQAEGGAAARSKAREVLRSGLRQVGVLVSDNFASLHPGYYVIFSGVYPSLDEAQVGASRAASRFPNSYARQIAR